MPGILLEMVNVIYTFQESLLFVNETEWNMKMG